MCLQSKINIKNILVDILVFAELSPGRLVGWCWTDGKLQCVKVRLSHHWKVPISLKT
jgi:hypothetical protein